MADTVGGATPNANAQTFAAYYKNLDRIETERTDATKGKFLWLIPYTKKADPQVLARLDRQRDTLDKIIEMFGKRHGE